MLKKKSITHFSTTLGVYVDNININDIFLRFIAFFFIVYKLYIL